MYKAGKHWVFAAITVGIFGFASTTSALADETSGSNKIHTEQTLNANESTDTTTDVSNEEKVTEAKLTTQDADVASSEEKTTNVEKEVTTVDANKDTTVKNVESSEQNTTVEDKNAIDNTAQVNTVEKENKYTQENVNGNWYLKDEQGNYLTGFQEIKDQNKTVYYNPDSKQMVYGQQNINGHWYLFDKTTGAMQRGFQNLKAYGDDKTVYYNQDGWMLYGQQKIDNKWYNFDTFNGAMKTGIVKIPEQNKTVYYAPNGQMQYGWQWVDNATRYFDTFNGAMATGQKLITGHWYLFDKNGAMQRGFQNLKDYGDNKTVYYNQDGWMLYGWQWVNNATRYFDTFNGAMTVGQKNIANHWYLFDKAGAMQRGFQYLPEDKKIVYYN